MQHEFRESKKVLTFLGEDENGITNIRHLGKFNKIASRPRPKLITFHNYWTVKQLLAGAFRLEGYNEPNESKIFLNRSSNKDEQEKRNFVWIKDIHLFDRATLIGNSRTPISNYSTTEEKMTPSNDYQNPLQLMNSIRYLLPSTLEDWWIVKKN